MAADLDAQERPGYKVYVDLNHVVRERIKIKVYPPEIREKEATYILPAVVPGAYKDDDFGRFVHDFSAFDRNGRSIPVKRVGVDQFLVVDARRLDYLSYWVEDTWHAPQDEKFVIQAGGTNFDQGKSYLLNHFGLYGYLAGHSRRPYEIIIKKPSWLYGASSLTVLHRSPEEDIVRAPDYRALADGPVLYAFPDTTSFVTGGARVKVLVRSENGIVRSKRVSEIMRPLAVALTNFFGSMPVPHYDFLFYFFGPNSPVASKSGKYGAMEHSYSSFYYLPEVADSVKLAKMLKDICSHEFLHVLTPLNIHSSEIGDFDFLKPKMSRHLWLYEGLTEYFTNLVQLQGGLTNNDEFRERIKDKIDQAAHFPDISFTEMSLNILQKDYWAMYPNVYQKGPLINFLLDIRIRELTNGRLGIRDVLLKLRQRYGPSRSFNDEKFVDEFVSLADPGLRAFFDAYVIGNQPLPYEEYFSKIGWRCVPARFGSANQQTVLEESHSATPEQLLLRHQLFHNNQ